jgi:hypothetical protein
VPRPKSEFDALYSYEVYEPTELLDADAMYRVDEVARLLQDLPPTAELDPETEDRLIAWTIPWLFEHRDELCISDPTGDEPGYFGLRAGVGDAGERTDETETGDTGPEEKADGA